MRPFRLSIALVAFVSVHATAMQASGQPRANSTLPLRTARLYETGVGYFERSGPIPGNTGVGLPVPAGHLDDALKTLVVLGADGTTSVTGIEFASSVTRDRARALAGLPSDGTESLDYAQLLSSLKGASVEVRVGGETVRGRLVDVLAAEQSDVETCVRATGVGGVRAMGGAGENPDCIPQRHMTLLLLTDRSEIRRLRSSDVQSVRPSDQAVASRLAAGVDTVSSRGSQTRRVLNVLASSSGPVTLGYIAESPVWRSTYRMVLAGAEKRGALQGWALLHNDTDEDWKQVRIELVNGQPDSFLFPLAAPRYARRDMLTPTEQLSTVPQLQDTTVDNMWRGDVGESYGAGGLGLTGVGEGGGGYGQGIGLGSIGTIGHGAGTGTGSSLLTVGNLASIAPADTEESGALFRYALPKPIDLRAHGSALVPFVQQTVSATRMAFFQAAGEQARAAVHVKNDTKQTLPPGTVAVFADGGFAGESALDRLKPAESQIVTFGNDLDVELDVVDRQSADELQVVSFDGGSLTEHFLRRHRVKFALVNRHGSARTAYLALDYVNNAKVEGADTLVWDGKQGKALAVFEVEARKQREPTLTVAEGLTRTHPLSELTTSAVRQLASAPKLPATQRESLLRVARSLQQADLCMQEEATKERRLRQVQEDLPRLRANLASVSATSKDAAEQFVAKIVASESEVQRLRARIATLRSWTVGHRANARRRLEQL
jgi:hypothetical protein